jgi:ferredoxin
MADIANKYAENVSGTFYVDDQCIDCDLCRETAPANFTRSDDGGYSYVFKQPTTPEEEALCKEAMEGCPVEAIGNNGEGWVWSNQMTMNCLPNQRSDADLLDDLGVGERSNVANVHGVGDGGKHPAHDELGCAHETEI